MTEITRDNRELSADDLDRAAGGIIIVGGLEKVFTSVFEKVSINPQPLPPRVLSLGGFFGR